MTSSQTSTKPDALASLNLQGQHSAVIGIQYGDEGKGQIVDVLGAHFDVVARYNGGANAGHTVIIGDQKFALHLIPSGIMCPDALNVVGNGVVIDPAQILKEIDGLVERGIAIGENLKISNRAHVVLPYHKVQDVLYDQAMAKAKGSEPIGTTGRGIGPCYADKALRTTAVRMGELLRIDELETKIQRIVSIKNTILEALAKTCDQPFEQLDANAIFADLKDQAIRLAPHITDTSVLLHDAMDDGKKILCEGANATMLDIDHGTYPFVTSSNCSSLGIYAGSGLPGGTIKNIIGIVKLYTSRVGEGPFPSELLNETGETIRQQGNEFGTTTGRPRRTGWLDLVSVRYASKLSGVTTFACTGLAVLAGLKTIKLCVGYRLDGKVIDNTLPANAGDLARAEPIYEEFEGFADPIGECQRYEDLPPQARAYVERVQELLGTRIAMVCVGRRRDQILVCPNK